MRDLTDLDIMVKPALFIAPFVLRTDLRKDETSITWAKS